MYQYQVELLQEEVVKIKGFRSPFDCKSYRIEFEK